VSDTVKVIDYYIPHDGKVLHVRKIGHLPLELVDDDAAVLIQSPSSASWATQAQETTSYEMVLYEAPK
jgi:hypothetical protein